MGLAVERLERMAGSRPSSSNRRPSSLGTVGVSGSSGPATRWSKRLGLESLPCRLSVGRTHPSISDHACRWTFQQAQADLWNRTGSPASFDASLPVAKGDEQITKLELQRFLGKLSPISSSMLIRSAVESVGESPGLSVDSVPTRS